MNDRAVWAVVTAFRPDRTLAGVLLSLRTEVAATVLVDDGSGEEFDELFRSLGGAADIIVRLPRNSGIAAALNAGIEVALNHGATDVLTLDQDSSIGPGFVAALQRTRADAHGRGVVVGAVVPEYFSDVRQARGKPIGSTLATEHVIQSGMLIGRTTIDRIGDMMESLFIDLVDTEYELRCRREGLEVIAAPGLRIEHALGARFRRRGRLPLPGIPRVMTLSAPFRYYYRARNRVLITRRYVRAQPRRITRDWAVDFVYFAVVAMVARPRRSMRRLIRAGRAAGRRGQGGRIPAELQALAETVTWHADRI